MSKITSASTLSEGKVMTPSRVGQLTYGQSPPSSSMDDWGNLPRFDGKRPIDMRLHELAKFLRESDVPGIKGEMGKQQLLAAFAAHCLNIQTQVLERATPQEKIFLEGGEGKKLEGGEGKKAGK